MWGLEKLKEPRKEVKKVSKKAGNFEELDGGHLENREDFVDDLIQKEDNGHIIV